MDTNFSRPSLGIAQSTLFNVSNAMANDKSLRFEFANDPQSFLNKQNVAISNGALDVCLKTSEIGCLPSLWCVTVAAFMGYVVAIIAGAVLVAGVAAGGAYAVMSCWTEWGGCSIENPLLTEKFKGMC